MRSIVLSVALALITLSAASFPRDVIGGGLDEGGVKYAFTAKQLYRSCLDVEMAASDKASEVVNYYAMSGCLSFIAGAEQAFFFASTTEAKGYFCKKKNLKTYGDVIRAIISYGNEYSSIVTDDMPAIQLYTAAVNEFREKCGL